MKNKIVALLLLAALTTGLLAGCGGSKYDVSLFIMTDGMLDKKQSQLKEELAQAAGETTAVDVLVSPLSNPSKLLLEIAAGDHDMVIVSKSNLDIYAKQECFEPLDKLYDPASYPEGVAEVFVDGDETKVESQLVGIPVGRSKWFREAGYQGDEAYVAILRNATDLKKAEQLLQWIAAK